MSPLIVLQLTWSLILSLSGRQATTQFLTIFYLISLRFGIRFHLTFRHRLTVYSCVVGVNVAFSFSFLNSSSVGDWLVGCSHLLRKPPSPEWVKTQEALSHLELTSDFAFISSSDLVVHLRMRLWRSVRNQFLRRNRTRYPDEHDLKRPTTCALASLPSRFAPMQILDGSFAAVCSLERGWRVVRCCTHTHTHTRDPPFGQTKRCILKSKAINLELRIDRFWVADRDLCCFFSVSFLFLFSLFVFAFCFRSPFIKPSRLVALFECSQRSLFCTETTRTSQLVRPCFDSARLDLTFPTAPS